MAEVEIMKGLEHPNIIEYHGYFKDYDFGADRSDKNDESDEESQDV
jgi:hypothetical protein